MSMGFVTLAKKWLKVREEQIVWTGDLSSLSTNTCFLFRLPNFSVVITFTVLYRWKTEYSFVDC